MIDIPNQYFVAETRTSPRICICRTEDLAALFNAGRIREDFVARIWTGTSSKENDANNTEWFTIAKLLKEQKAVGNTTRVTAIALYLDPDAYAAISGTLSGTGGAVTWDQMEFSNPDAYRRIIDFVR